MTHKALFAISTLGLGHATRTLPIIQHYLSLNYHIDIVCYGNALNYLRTELHGEKVRFFELLDYPPIERWSGRSFYPMLISDILTTMRRIHREQAFLTKLEKENNYHFIFSDGKYGFYSEKTPCYLLTHQLSFEIPKIFKPSQIIVDYRNRQSFSHFTHIFIPDYKDPEYNLCGKLAHPRWLSKLPHSFIGILSSFGTPKAQKQIQNSESETIDYLFTISGYLAEHRESFIQTLINQSKLLKGKKVFILWDTKQKDYYHYDSEHNIEIFGYLAGIEKIKKFAAAKVIISRAGYTTIMDLIELGKPAILYPTPNQTEQLYLADYLGEKKLFVKAQESDHLIDLIKNLNSLHTFPKNTKTAQAIKLIYNTLPH